MKKLSLSILLLMTSLSVFSQNVTKDSSAIQLRKPIARLVIKDLIKGDGAQIEITNLQQTLTATEQKVALKDSIIVTQGNKIGNLNEIIFKKDEQFKLQQQLSKDLERSLKAANTRVFLFKMGTGVAIVSTLLLLVK
jgi:hypothetical protein